MKARSATQRVAARARTRMHSGGRAFDNRACTLYVPLFGTCFGRCERLCAVVCEGQRRCFPIPARRPLCLSLCPGLDASTSSLDEGPPRLDAKVRCLDAIRGWCRPRVRVRPGRPGPSIQYIVFIHQSDAFLKSTRKCDKLLIRTGPWYILFSVLFHFESLLASFIPISPIPRLLVGL